MKCPNQGCNVPINYYTLKGNLSPELYAEYDKLKAEAPELARKNEERSISCPKCNILSIIWIDADYFKCPSCGIQYCSNENCYGEWDKHQNMNCSQYKKKYTLSDQKMFEEFIKKKGWMQCPKCNVVIEKKGNCNTIRCESRKCCKKTLFCYTCGKELANDEMGPHFPNGDFQVCINVMPQNKIKNNPNEMLKNKDESIQPFLKKGKEVKKVEESKDFCSTLCDYLIYCCFPNKCKFYFTINLYFF
jgi:hypothetical protein